MPHDGNRRIQRDWPMTVAVAISTATIVLALVLLSRRLESDLSPMASRWAALGVAIATACAAAVALGLRSLCRRPVVLSDAVRFAEFLITTVPAAVVSFAVLPDRVGWAVGISIATSAFSAAACFGSVLLELLGQPAVELPETIPQQAALSAAAVGDLSQAEPGERWEGAAVVTVAQQAGKRIEGRLPIDDEAPEVESCTTEPSAEAAWPAAVAFDRLANESAVVVSHERVVQWSTRSCGADGEERIEGGVTVTFAPGQRQAAAHMAFSPPLAAAPEIECEVVEGDEVRLRVSAAHPWGVRIEAKRSGRIDEAATVQIGFVAVAGTLRSAA